MHNILQALSLRLKPSPAATLAVMRHRKKESNCKEKCLFLVMETREIISEIKKLTVKERLQIIEKTARTIQMDDEKEQMRKAADQLYDDYKDDAELTVFTDLDLEEFYEAR